MTKMIGFHEVEDGDHWAKAWRKGPGSRHEMFAEFGITVLGTFQDPTNPNLTGVLFDVSDMEKFQEIAESEESQKAMAEDGIKIETLRMLVEFTP